MKEKKAALKALVKQLAEESHAVTAEKQQKKNTSTDEQKHSQEYGYEMSALAERRSLARWKGRAAHLAYGFVRGVPYSVMEIKTNDDVLHVQYFIAQYLKECEVEFTDEQLGNWLESGMLVQRYVHLWKELGPISQAEDDTPEGERAETIRSEMDDYWKKLTEGQRKEVEYRIRKAEDNTVEKLFAKKVGVREARPLAAS